MGSTNFTSFLKALETLLNTPHDPLGLIQSLTLTCKGILGITNEIDNLALVARWMPKMTLLQSLLYTGFSYDSHQMDDILSTFAGLETGAKIALPINSVVFCRAIENLEIHQINIDGI